MGRKHTNFRVLCLFGKGGKETKTERGKKRVFGLSTAFYFLKNKNFWGFPGGTMVKNPPANAGDMGLSPGPGRSHMLQSNSARAPQLLSLRSRAREPQLLKPACLEPVPRNKRSHRNEKPAHHNEE